MEKTEHARVIRGALDEIQARRERLARGQVAGSLEPRPATTTATLRDRTAGGERATVSRAGGRPYSPQHEILWITRTLVRLWPKTGRQETMGTVEFVRRATLADVRVLVDEFHPLPQRRQYEFYHPGLRIPIDPSDERNLRADEYDRIIVVALPRPSKQPPAFPSVATRETQDIHPASPFDDQSVQKEPVLESTVVPAEQHKPRRRNKSPQETEASSVMELHYENQMIDGVLYDLTVREFEGEGTAGISATVLEGELAGVCTPLKILPTADVARFISYLNQPRSAKGQVDSVDAGVHLFKSVVSLLRTHGGNLGRDGMSFEVDHPSYQEIRSISGQEQTNVEEEEVPLSTSVADVSCALSDSDMDVTAACVSSPTVDKKMPTQEGKQVEEVRALEEPWHHGTRETHQEECCAGNTMAAVEAIKPEKLVDTNAAISSLGPCESSKGDVSEEDGVSEVVSDVGAILTPINDEVPSSNHNEQEVTSVPSAHVIVNTATSRGNSSAFDAQTAHQIKITAFDPKAQNGNNQDVPEAPRLPAQSNLGQVARGETAQAEDCSDETQSIIPPTCQRYVDAFMNLLLEEFDQSFQNPALSIFSLSQLQESFTNYGIDHAIFGLNGVFLAIEDEISTWGCDQWSEVARSFAQYVSDYISRLSESSTQITSGRKIFLIESALNIVADMFSWYKPTRIRLEILERDSSSIDKFSELKGKPFKLTDAEHSLLGGIYTSDFSTLDSWLADSLEALYFLYHASVTAAGKDKMALDRTRQDRLRWIIQRIVNSDPSVWRKAELRISVVHDAYLRSMLLERLVSFSRDQKELTKLVDQAVFLPALMGFMDSKAKQAAKSLSDALLEPAMSEPSPFALNFLAMTKTALDKFSLGCGKLDIFLQDLVFRACDIRKVNEKRAALGLSRVSASGEFSLLTHHQCMLLASDYGLRMRPRWDQSIMVPGKKNRYIFHGDDSIGVEFVYVRRKLNRSQVCEYWEDAAHFAEVEASRVCRDFFEAGKSRPASSCCAVGVNALHLDLFRENVGFTSPDEVLLKLGAAHSISIGYHVVRDPKSPSIRLMFRIHVGNERRPSSRMAGGSDSPRPTLRIMRALNTFVCSAEESAIVAFLDHGGLVFLRQCSPDMREQRWLELPFGYHFRPKLQSVGFEVAYDQDEIAFFTCSMLSFIPRNESLVSAAHILLLQDLATGKSGSHSEKTVVAAVHTFKLLCMGGTHTSESKTLAPLNRIQRRFLEQMGLPSLVECIDFFQPGDMRSILEDGLVSLLCALEMCSFNGFLVHHTQWLKYFVDSEMWRRHARLTCQVLHQIHLSFFTSDFTPSDQVKCKCGCGNSTPANLTTFSGVVELFCSLLTTEEGVCWGLQDMQGVTNCLRYIQNTVKITVDSVCDAQRKAIFAVYELGYQASKSDTGLEFVRKTRSLLFSLLEQARGIKCEVDIVRIIGLCLGVADVPLTWSMPDYYATEEVLCILTKCFDLCSGVTKSFNEGMSNVLFQEADDKVFTSDAFSFILHREHNEDQRHRSIIESFMSLLDVNAESVVKQFCVVPVLVTVGMMIQGSPAIAADFDDLKLIPVLLQCMEAECTEQQVVLAGEVLSILCFQLMRSPSFKVDDDQFRRVTNFIAVGLEAGAQMSLPHRHISMVDSPAELRFTGEPDRRHVITQHASVMEWIRQNEPASIHDVSEVLWIGHPWGDFNFVKTERYVMTLRLLAVITCSLPLAEALCVSSELEQITKALSEFVSHRLYVADNQVLLYLFALRNILRMFGNHLANMQVSVLLESGFLRRLLVYSRRRSSYVPELASNILWILSNSLPNQTTLSAQLQEQFNLHDESRGDLPEQVKPGIAVLMENIQTKLVHGQSIECDAGALTALLRDQTNGVMFFASYRFSHVTRWIDMIRSAGFLFRSDKDRQQSLLDRILRSSKNHGHREGYAVPLTTREKELLQLCELARICLIYFSRSDTSSLLLESSRTKASIIPLLDDKNPLILHAVLGCIVVHVAAHRDRSSELLEPRIIDRVFGLCFDSAYSPTRAKALLCTRMLMGDIRCLQHPYKLRGRLLQSIQPLIDCLKCTDLDVKKQAIELAVSIVSKFDDSASVALFTKMFVTPENQQLLSDVFASLCREFPDNPDAGNVLQQLVALVIQLDIVAVIDGDVLVESICLAIQSRGSQAFLRPLLCTCLCNLSTQPDASSIFARKSRLRAIVTLLNGQLTIGEMKSIGALLNTLATSHRGIRQFLSSHASGCVGLIVRVLGGFLETTVESSGAPPRQVDEDSISAVEEDDSFGVLKARVLSPTDAEKYLLKVTLGSNIFISNYTDEVYEEFMRCLLLLLQPWTDSWERYGCPCKSEAGCMRCDPCDLIAKVHGVQSLLHLLIAKRVIVASNNLGLGYFIEASGLNAPRITLMAIEILKIISSNGLCRLDMLRHASWDLWWLSWLIARSEPGALLPIGQAADVTITTLTMLGHLCAEAVVKEFLLDRRTYILVLFSYINSQRPVIFQRAALFIISRLVEDPRIAKDRLFQEMINPLIAQCDRFQDRVAHANLIVLVRNMFSNVPKLRQRLLDSSLVDGLVRCIDVQSSELASLEVDEVFCIGWEVLSLVLAETGNGVRLTTQKRESVVQNAFSRPDVMKQLRQSLSGVCRRIFVDTHEEESSGNKLRMQDLRLIVGRLYGDESDAKLLEMMVAIIVSQIKQIPIITRREQDNSDVIQSTEDETVLLYPQNLQYSVISDVQNARAGIDTSFRGSVHLWRFIRCVWNICARGNDADQCINQFPIEQVIGVLTSWVGSSSSSATSGTLERRQRLISFINDVLRSTPALIKRLKMHEIVPVLEEHICLSGSAGAGYELLYLLCWSSLHNASWLVSHLGSRDHGQVCAASTDAFIMLWSAARPAYFERVLGLSSYKTGNPQVRMYLLEPSPPSSSSMSFALILLTKIIEYLPSAPALFLECHSPQMLLDLLLVESTVDTRSTAVPDQQVLAVSLLTLLKDMIELHPNLVRFFIADPRLISAVVTRVFAVKIPIQLAAVELLRVLVTKPSVLRLLRRCEQWTTSMEGMERWEYDTLHRNVTRLNLAPLTRHELIKLAHVQRIPLFWGLKTAELVKLSASFVESRHAVPDALCVLVTDENETISTIPQWVRSSMGLHASPSTNTPGGSTIESAWMYSLVESGYQNSAVNSTQRSIAARCEIYCTASTTSSLIRRLCRFLVETRAELLRRVAFAKRRPESIVAAELPLASDMLGVLARTSLFTCVSRDSLACLVMELGDPIRFTVSTNSSLESLPLLVLRSDVSLPIRTEDHNCLRLRRGSILGSPSWLIARDEPDKRTILVLPSTFRASIITPSVLQAALRPAEYKALMEHWTEIKWPEQLTYATSSLANSSKTDRDGKLRDLQASSLQLLRKLVLDPVHRQAFMDDPRALITIIDVIRSELDQSTVRTALDIILYLARSGGAENALCNHEASFRLLQPSQMIREYPDLLSRWMEVLVLITERSLMIRESMAKWCTDSVFESVERAFEYAGKRQEPPVSAARVLEVLVQASKEFSISQCKRFSFHVHVAKALNAFCHGDVQALLKLFVRFDADLDMRDGIQHLGVDFSRVLTQVTSDLIVAIRTADAAVVATCAEFMCIVLRPQANGSRSMTACKMASALCGRSILEAVLRDLHRCDALVHVLLKCVASICLGDTMRAEIAAKTIVQGPSSRVRFLRFVSNAMSTLSPRSTWGPDAAHAVAVMECINALSPIPYASEHFIRHGFVSISVHLLKPWSSSLSKGQLQVASSILQTLSNCIKNCAAQLSSILRSHSEAIQLLLLRLRHDPLPWDPHQVTRKHILGDLFRFFTCSVENCESNNIELDAYRWLVSDIVPILLEVLANDEGDGNTYDRDVDHTQAAIRYLSVLCLHKQLVFDLIGNRALLSQVAKVLCSGIRRFVSSDDMLTACGEILCSLAESLDSIQAVDTDEDSFRRLVLPELIELSHVSQGLRWNEYMLRTLWLLMVDSDTSESEPTNDVYVRQVLGLAKQLVLQPLSNRAFINLLGLLGTIADQSDEEAVMQVCVELLEGQCDRIVRIRETQLLVQSFSWNSYRSRHWNQADANEIMRLGLAHLLVHVHRYLCTNKWQSGIGVQNSSWVAAMHQFVLDDALMLLKRTHCSPFDCAVSIDAAVFIRSFVSCLRSQTEALKRAQRLCRERQLVYNAKRVVCCSSCSGFSKAQLLFALVEVVDSDIAACVAISRLPTGDTNHILEAVLCRLADDQGDVTAELLIAGFRFVISCVEVSVANAKLCADALHEKVWRGLIRRIRAQQEKDLGVLVEFFRCCKAIWQLTPQYKKAWIVGLWPLISASTSLANSTSVAVCLLGILPSTVVSSCIVNTWDDQGRVFVRSLFRLIVSPVEPNVLDSAASILCNFVQAYPNLCFEVTADRSLEELLIRTFLAFHSEATEDLICDLLRAETQNRSRSAVMIALCGEISRFRSQCIESQSALLILQPALLPAMDKYDAWHLVTEKTWRAVFVSGLSLLQSTDYDGNQRVALGVEALIRSGRVRQIQHEASSLRELLVHWHDTGLIPSVTLEMSEYRDYNVSSHVVALWLRICVTLGFTVDIPRFRAIALQSLTADVFYAEPYDSRSPTQAVLNLARLQTLVGESLHFESMNNDSALYVVALVLCKANLGGYHRVLSYVASRLLVSPSANTVLRHRLLQGESDVIDRIAWEWHTNGTHYSFGVADIAATGSLLISVAVNSSVIQRISYRRIIDMWMFELSYSGSHESFYRSAGNQVMIRLIAIVLNHSRDDDALRDLFSHHQCTLVRYAVNSLALSSKSTPNVSSALDILYHVVQSDEVVQELWRACLLVDVERNNVPALSTRSTILASVMNILLQPNEVDRQRASYVVYQLVRSPFGSDPLVKARQPCRDSFHGLLTSTLLQSIGAKVQRTLRWDISNFQRLSDVFPSLWSLTRTTTAMYTLRTLHRCLRSPVFLTSLWSEISLFAQLFTALATHNLEVAYAASTVLRDALVDGTQEERDRAASTRAEDAIKPSRVYRQLIFFSDLRRHGLFDLIPACSMPSSFLVLALWIEYYSHNANAWEDDRACEHLLCIEDVMLYVLQHHYSQVYDATRAHETDFQHHQRLCEALLRLCDCGHKKSSKSPRASVHVRVRGLEILHTLCNYAVTRFPLGLFLSLKNISSVFSIVETARDDEESTITNQLLCDFVSVPEGKTLAITYPVVLSRLSSWLQKRDPKLVAAAASAIKHLVIIPVGFDRTAEQAILSAVAHAFFVCHYPTPDSIHNVHQLRSTRVVKCTGRVFIADKARGSEHAFVILHFVVRDSAHQSLREFQSRHMLRPSVSNEGFEHTVLLEDEAAFVACETVVRLDGLSPPRRTNHRRSSVTCKTSLILDLNSPSAFTSVDGHAHIVQVEMTQTDHILDSNALGLLGRVLAHPDSPRQVVQEVATVVAQLSKSHAIFCEDALVRLKWHVLAVLDATWQDPRRLDAQGMDLTCLNALTHWFWQGKVSVSHFRKSAPHVLDLVRWMRSCAFIRKPLSPNPTQDNEGFKHAPAHSSSCFLTALMEWIAVMEVDMLTENCINTLFIENADVLLAMCTQFYPRRSAVASFFMLAATVVRVNRVHCEVFARKHVVRTLFQLLTGAIADIRDENTASAAETLQFAARVAAKISRSDITADTFLRHNGLAFMGLIAYSIYSSVTWPTSTFPTAVAENLVLACAFLCEAHGKSRPVQWFAERPSANALSVIEMLVFFLGRSGDLSTEAPSSSIERTAATILRSLIERWPSRMEFEATLLHLVHQNDHVSRSSGAFRPVHAHFVRGLQRCILLTARDFYSDLNVVRRTYSAAISVSVRTGVTPLKCRNVFASFDRDYMSLAIKNPTADDGRTASWRTVAMKWSLPGTSARHDNLPDDGDQNLTSDAVVLEELHVALRFVLDHRLLVEALVENRKKALLRGITVANQNAKILVGIHAVLAVAFDAFVDALASSIRNSAGKSDREKSSAFSTHTTVFQRWIVLLEHIGGILCCGFQDLDASYYNDLFQQLHQLLTELPRFLERIERLQSRRDSAETILNNLERLLKRITSKHELRGVTATGVGVTQDAKSYMDTFRVMKRDVTAALATALEAPDAMDRISRAIVAAEYVWRRVVGPDSLATFMIGVKDTESLWVKIWAYLVMIGGFCRRPGSVVMAAWGKFYGALGKIMTIFSDDTQKPRNMSTNMLDEGEIKKKDSQLVLQVSSSDRWELAERYGVAMNDVVISDVPFTGLESLLDHYGFVSLGVKKALSLLNIDELRDEVSTLMSGALQKDLSVVQRMTRSELEQALGLLDQDTSHHLMEALRVIADSADLGIQLPLVVRRPYEVGLWQFVVQPLLRVRLHTAYQLIKTYGESNEIRRREILKAVKELAEAEALTFNDAMDPSSAALSLEDAETVGSIGQNEDRLWIKSAHRATVAVQPMDARLGKRRVAVTALADSAASSLYSVRAEGNEVLSSDILSLVDHVSLFDPLSEEKIIESLRQSAAKSRNARILPPRWLPKWLGGRLGSSQRYLTVVRISSSHSNRFVRKMKVVMLFLAFWRQEDFERDLKNDAWRKAFDSSQERDDYFLSYHLHRAFSELLRVWMPENGTLGLSLWHWRAYSLGGGLICILLSTLCTLISASLYIRNQVMTIIVYVYIGSVFVLVAVSMVSITQKHFVLQERNRFRLQPIGLYYQNVLAVITILVDIVQLNSITFDPTINWNQSDQIPKLIQWLSETGIAQMRVEQVELKALLTGIVLFIWFFVLKCPNKFQESSPFLNRVVTKDLPFVLNSLLYMGFISIFFSFLSCIDCRGAYGYLFAKCDTSPDSPPFLLSHHNISCWTLSHTPYAFLGLWGITFFLPIGILAQGMSQVLFQEETVDIKYAPIVVLVSQLIKAMAATARAFFTFNPIALASLALVGNGVLFMLMVYLKSASLWYIKLIKSGIFAASCWSALCAIREIRTANESSSISMNLIYLGWLGIAAVTVAAIVWRSWRREEAKFQAEKAFSDSQRHLAVTSKPLTLGRAQRQFLRLAEAHTERPSTRVKALHQRATRLVNGSQPMPSELEGFVRRARAYASTESSFLSSQSALSEATFMQNARQLARQLDQQEPRRFRGRAHPKDEATSSRKEKDN